MLHFTLDMYLILLSVKQGGIKYHFLSLWYDTTWDWTPGLQDHLQTFCPLDQWASFLIHAKRVVNFFWSSVHKVDHIFNHHKVVLFFINADKELFYKFVDIQSLSSLSCQILLLLISNIISNDNKVLFLYDISLVYNSIFLWTSIYYWELSNLYLCQETASLLTFPTFFCIFFPFQKW